MNLIKRLASEVKRNRWWDQHTKVVIGVSTGVDSMVLLYLLEHLRYQRPRIIVAHVNHELRSASKTEERYIRKYCKEHGLTLVVAHWRKKDHPKTGTENAAREFRYRFFKHVMIKKHAQVLLTAHHLNDQAETILMRLIRGGDLNELTGIHRCRSFANGRLIRPLLTTPKRCLRSFAKGHHIKWYEDQTNYSLKITRNRMRHRLLPWMEQEDPQTLNHIGQYVHQLTMLIQDNQILNSKLVPQVFTKRKNWWKLEVLRQYPKLIQRGLLRELFREFNSSLMITPPMMDEIIDLLNNPDRPQGQVNISHQIRFEKVYQRFGIQSRPVYLNHRNETFLVIPNRWYPLLNGEQMGIFTQRISATAVKHFQLDLKPAEFPLRVRLSRPDDRIRLKNGGHQKVRRIWIDRKLSNRCRCSSQILETKNGAVLALMGYKTSFLPNRRGTKPYWLNVKGH